MSTIHFKTKLFEIGSWTILHLPKDASAKLPSRGMTYVEGTINDFPFSSPLEPDGTGSHWFRLTNAIMKVSGVKANDTVTLSIEPLTKEWPDPEIPEDLKKALASHSKANELWKKITPNARWDWIRWINLTREAKTRVKRIEVACSKIGRASCRERVYVLV